jgi:predicted DNA-binding transcriptional regulator AlpA
VVRGNVGQQSQVSHSEFVGACSTVAAVMADAWWRSARQSLDPKRSNAQGLAAAMNCAAAAKHCGFGRTKFRELVASGAFPQPVTIDGCKRWLAKDLDAALVRLGKGRGRM